MVIQLEVSVFLRKPLFNIKKYNHQNIDLDRYLYKIIIWEYVNSI